VEELAAAGGQLRRLEVGEGAAAADEEQEEQGDGRPRAKPTKSLMVPSASHRASGM
jgi:hypothetical protein